MRTDLLQNWQSNVVAWKPYILQGMQEGVVYIYALADPRTSAVRYIGKTVSPYRRYYDHITQRNGNTHCSKWIEKLMSEGIMPQMQIIWETDEENWAEEEINTIAEYSRYSRLTNIDKGGHGCPRGIPKTEEALRKIGRANIGKKRSPEQRKRMSRAATGRGLGKRHSDEHRKKIGDSQRGHTNPRSKPIVQYTLEMQLVKLWDCALYASQAIGISRVAIQMCATGRTKTAAGFIWKYARDVA